MKTEYTGTLPIIALSSVIFSGDLVCKSDWVTVDGFFYGKTTLIVAISKKNYIIEDTTVERTGSVWQFPMTWKRQNWVVTLTPICGADGNIEALSGVMAVQDELVASGL